MGDMAATPATSEYDNRTVRVTYKDGSRQSTIEGMCLSYRSGRAILVKTNKKPYGDMIVEADIVTVEIIHQNNIIEQTAIKPVTVRDVRRHLLNYHGWVLSEVNNISDEDALVVHEKIHTRTPEYDPHDLGHNHTKTK